MSTTDRQSFSPTASTTSRFESVGRRPTWLIAAVLWLTVTSGFVAFRNFPFYVWDDTPCMIPDKTSGLESSAQVLDGRREKLRRQPGQKIGELTIRAFSNVQPGGYRPLAALQSSFLSHCVDLRQPALLHLGIWGTVYGLFAVILWRVSARFLGENWWALAPVALTLGSPPVVGAGLVLVAGFQIIVPLIMCSALLLYWQATEGRRARRVSVVALATLLLLGPWYREVLLVLPFLLGGIELYRARRLTPLHVLFAVAFLHALFPTALVKLIAIPDLPLKSVTQMGLARFQLQGGVRWFAAWHFLPLLPPMLVAVGIGAAVWQSGAGARALLQQRPRFSFESLFNAAVVLWLGITVLMLVRASFLHREEEAARFGTLLMLGLPMAVLRKHPALALWFGVTFLPVLRVFTEHVHFMYAMVPASIIAVVAVKEFHALVPCAGTPERALRWSLVGLLALSTLDQCCHIPASRSVAESQYRGIHDVVRTLTERLPRGSFVVTNVVHGVEIAWRANNHINLKTSVSAGVEPYWSVEAVPEMVGLLEAHPGGVYLLDCDFDYLPNKQYHRHKYVHSYDLEKEDLGIIHTTSAQYVYLDPLRYFVPRRFMPFLGAPDLENDFYTGPGRRPGLFRSEMYVEYHLFRVTGQTLTPAPSSSCPTNLVAELYHGMNILENNGAYFAIPCDGTPFDAEMFRKRQYSQQFSDQALEGIKGQVERAALASAGSATGNVESIASSPGPTGRPAADRN